MNSLDPCEVSNSQWRWPHSKNGFLYLESLYLHANYARELLLDLVEFSLTQLTALSNPFCPV